MGLLNKIKGILFEEVEEDEVVNTPKSEEKKPIAEKIEPQKKVEEVETPKVNVVKPKAEVEHERKKKMEKRYDMGSFTKVERTEVVEKKKFKPSPIISPVYGILNEDYRPEDIKNKSEVSTSNNLDFNSVRKKAFGEEVKEEPKTTYYEETVTVKLKENDEEKKQKVYIGGQAVMEGVMMRAPDRMAIAVRRMTDGKSTKFSAGPSSAAWSRFCPRW